MELGSHFLFLNLDYTGGLLPIYFTQHIKNLWEWWDMASSVVSALTPLPSPQCSLPLPVLCLALFIFPNRQPLNSLTHFMLWLHEMCNQSLETRFADPSRITVTCSLVVLVQLWKRKKENIKGHFTKDRHVPTKKRKHEIMSQQRKTYWNDL